MRLPCAELEVPYHERPHGSSSKLRTVRDGIAIFKTIFALIKEERPLECFFSVFVLLELAAVILAWPLLTEYLETGLVPRIPTAVLSTGLALLGFLSLAGAQPHPRHRDPRTPGDQAPALSRPAKPALAVPHILQPL